MGDDEMFIRGYSLGELVISPNERLLVLGIGYSRQLVGKYDKMNLRISPEEAKRLAKELGELAEELSSTHH